ncbi:MAG: hypothetical protein MRY74_14510 [Neomegalonema sp.]|nr:hypothetical protein [Neomegalonema sp.]
MKSRKLEEELAKMPHRPQRTGRMSTNIRTEVLEEMRAYGAEKRVSLAELIEVGFALIKATDEAEPD